jgi:VCBS repeat-containing protein
VASLSPEIDLNGGGSPAAVVYAENDPITPIAPAATVSDSDSPDFEQGSLAVAFTSGASEGDQLRVLGGDFSVEETDLYYLGIPIGTITGGTDGSAPLLVTFNADSTLAVVAALIRAIGYVTYSENPAAGERIVTFTLTDGDGGTSAERTATVNVAGTDTPPVAQDDAIAANENEVATGSLFVDNGNDHDSDADGPVLEISEVNGSADNVGSAVVLDSGAILTVKADGSYSYDPNGRFNGLAAIHTGAVNSSTIGDTFTYRLAGGNVATVTVTVNGVASPGDRLLGDEGDNDIRGTEAADVFVLDHGGYDTPMGLGGDDIFYFGAAMASVGMVDGGDGYDTVVLQGDYSDGLQLYMMFYDVEAISLLAGSNTAFGGSGQDLNSYEIRVIDQHFAAGIRAKINGSALLPGENFYFFGSAETDADFLIYGGRGTDLLWGGQGNDIFFFDIGRFAAGDKVEGGSGYDGLFLRGNYTLDFRDAGFERALVGIENITLTSAIDTRYARGGGSEFDYNLILAEPSNGTGPLTVSGASLTAAETMVLIGSEIHTALRLFGGAANDTLLGGGGADLIHGALGGDELQGGGGADSFRYQAAAESVNGSADHILDFTPGTDRIELDRIDADALAAGDQAFTWIGSDAFGKAAGELRAFQSGGQWIVEGDVDGDGSADLVIALTLQGSAPLGAGDFVL